MLKGKNGIVLTIMLAVALLFSAVQASTASAYLHVANAQNYAKGHVWRTLCNSSYYNCGNPYATGWYSRISSSYVRVEIAVYRPRNQERCTRVFAVRGSDASPYITTDGSSPYYYCQAVA